MGLKNGDFTGDLVKIAIGNKPEHWDITYLNGETPDGFDVPALAPESQVLSANDLPEHEHGLFLPNGGRVWKVFKGQAPIHFDVSQRVDDLIPGAFYKVTFQALLDIYDWQGKKVYPTDQHAAEARAGIDGTWGDWHAPAYNSLEFGAYRNVAYLFVAPPGGAATVKLQCKAKWGGKHWSNNFFLYAVTLEQVGDPLPNGHRGEPRVQYERTYVLMPPDATIEEWHAAVDKHFPDRRTIGGSADDGGIGDLDVRRVIVEDPSRWPNPIVDFYEQYYPGVEVITPEVNRIILSMRDPEWKDEPLAFDCPYTIGQQGCFMTGLPMAQRFYGIDNNATPITCRDALGPSGFANCLPLWAAIKAKLGMSITDKGDLIAHLVSGKCAMIEVQPKTLEHFVLVVPHEGMEQGNFWVYDPIDGSEGWLDEKYAGAESFRLLTPVEDEPEPEPTPTNHTLVTGHISGSLPAFQHYLRTAKPRGIKMIAWDVRTVYQWHPGIEAILLRKWYGNNPSHDYFLNAQDKAKVAKEYVDLVLGELPQEAQWLYDQGWRGRIGLESLNEPYCNLCENNAKARDFEIAFCHELMSRGIPLVVPACMNAGVGNPHHNGETAEIIEPVAKVLGLYNGFWCTHNYGPVWQGVSHLEDQWQWYAGRVDWWLNILKKYGVDLFFTEGGPITGAPPLYQPQEYGGWKTSNCYNGNWPATRGFLVRLNQLLNKAYGDMCYGNAIFATGESEQWEKTFGIGQAQWDDLAAHLG